MPTRRIAMLVVACALAAPATSAAAADPGPSTGGTAAPPEDPALSATAHVLVGKVATFSGSLPADAGRTVTIERYEPDTDAWVALTTAPIADDGAYLASWVADVPGRLRTRATVQRDEEVGAALAPAVALEASVTVYRRAVASWYGPGFFGRRTACGIRMTRQLLGVAHRRLPCGTQVALTYKGKAITVPVVDRGPFAEGRHWDLTAAAAARLRFSHTDRLGAIRVG